MHEIRVISTKTGQIRVLKPDLSYLSPRFRWSPDGRSFIGAAAQPKRATYQIDSHSGQATAIVEASQSQPVWSRDGRGIFYVKRVSGKSSIVYRDLQTKAERNVLASGNELNDLETSFAFEPSPDGRQLALLGAPNRTSMALWLIPMVGGAPRELLKVNGPRPWVMLYTLHGGDETQRGLWYISANGREPQKIAVTGVDTKSIMHFAIHPDGKQLAFSATGTGKSEVWAMENLLPPLADSRPSAAAATDF
jgi:Tol biopolymer transport system component